ncbi:MAG: KEOPS complex subunit Cgi121 [Candidatus Bathyarchaeota archaeon]|nr:KEOPS complex subunit Cgi121 [Candidatus Bathyarchaeota archaeon]
MLCEMEEFGKFVEITGYSDISLATAEAFLKENRKQNQTTNIQFFDADLIATQEHLYFAALNALQAFKNKTNISKSPAMEAMLYASAQRQIQKAIEHCGIKPKTTNMAVLIIADTPEQTQTILQDITACVGKKPDSTVLEMTKNKQATIERAFGITEQELKTTIQEGDEAKAIVNLIIERVALLATQF